LPTRAAPTACRAAGRQSRQGTLKLLLAPTFSAIRTPHGISSSLLLPRTSATHHSSLSLQRSIVSPIGTPAPHAQAPKVPLDEVELRGQSSLLPVYQSCPSSPPCPPCIPLPSPRLRQDRYCRHSSVMVWAPVPSKMGPPRPPLPSSGRGTARSRYRLEIGWADTTVTAPGHHGRAPC
jgi:hypothetical protein